MVNFLIALMCLSMNIYSEDRSGYDEMATVALVTMNRADHDPDRVCEVVTQPYQFSWFNGYTRAKTDEERLRALEKMVPKEGEAFLRSMVVAKKALDGTIEERLVKLVGDADHYYNPRLANPGWKDKMRKVAVVGEHHLYSSGVKPLTRPTPSPKQIHENIESLMASMDVPVTKEKPTPTYNQYESIDNLLASL